MSMVVANVICGRLTAAAQNDTTLPRPAPNWKSFLLAKEPKVYKANGGKKRNQGYVLLYHKKAECFGV